MHGTRCGKVVGDGSGKPIPLEGLGVLYTVAIDVDAT